MKHKSVLVALKSMRTSGSAGELIRSVSNIYSPDEITWFAIDREDTDENLQRIAMGKLNSVPFRTSFLCKLSRILFIFSLLRVFLVYRFTVASKFDLIVTNSSELAFGIELSGLVSLKKIFLVADISNNHRHGFLSLFANAIDSFCSRKNWYVSVTSPAFYSNFLKSNGFKQDRCYLVHNKPQILKPSWELTQTVINGCPSQVNIVWAGLFRCERSASMLDMALQHRPRLFHLRVHSPDTRKQDKFLANLCQRDEVEFMGRYSIAELPMIHSNASFVWCGDWSLPGNSEFLLPNRLYYAIYACIPIICSSNTFLENVVNEYKIGFSVSNYNDLIEGLENCEASYAIWKKNIFKVRDAISDISEWNSIITGDALSISSGNLNGKIFD